jgi:hypothetical protein
MSCDQICNTEICEAATPFEKYGCCHMKSPFTWKISKWSINHIFIFSIWSKEYYSVFFNFMPYAFINLSNHNPALTQTTFQQLEPLCKQFIQLMCLNLKYLSLLLHIMQIILTWQFVVVVLVDVVRLRLWTAAINRRIVHPSDIQIWTATVEW